MKSYAYFFLLLLILSQQSFAQPAGKLKVIKFSNAFKVITPQAQKEEGGHFNLIFSNGVTIYEVPWKEMDISKYEGAPLPIFKATDSGTNYYVVKGMDRYGLRYPSISSKLNVKFAVDSLLTNLGINVSDLEIFSRDLGKPVLVKREKNTHRLTYERYAYQKKQANDPDFIDKYYDVKLIDIPFSFSKLTDTRKKTKLVKVVFSYSAYEDYRTVYAPGTIVEISKQIEKVNINNEVLLVELLKRFEQDYQSLAIK